MALQYMRQWPSKTGARVTYRAAYRYPMCTKAVYREFYTQLFAAAQRRAKAFAKERGWVLLSIEELLDR